MNIRIFKLVDGSELIGKIRVYNESSEIFILEDALEIKYRISPETGMSAAMMIKYNYFGEESTIRLNAAAVIASYAVSEKYSNFYEKSLVTARSTPQMDDVPDVEGSPGSHWVISGNNSVH